MTLTMLRTRYILAGLLLLCGGSISARTFGQSLSERLESTRWVAYAPTGYYPNESPPVYPGAASVRQDLVALRSLGFDGLVTYAAEIEEIPAIAEELGFHAVLLGIWEPGNQFEREKALQAVRKHRDLIVGIIVGNEGIQSARYTVSDLCSAMREIGLASGKPISTTETAEIMLSMPKLGRCSNFITANVHPYFAGVKQPREAVSWTLDIWNELEARYGRTMPVFLKEVGLPSAGDPSLSEDNQREYYQRLSRTSVKFAYFEAFDATPRFKSGTVEQSWGLLRSDRSQKPVVDALPWRQESR